MSGPGSDIYEGDGRGRSPTLESQLRGADPSVPFIPHIPSQASRRAGVVPEGVPEGAPEGAPLGVPAGVPAGVPTGVPAGVPTGVPTAEGDRSLEGAPYVPRSGTDSGVLPIPEPQTRGHIVPASPSEPYEVPRSPTYSDDGYGGPREGYGGPRDEYGRPRDDYGGPRDDYGGPRDDYEGSRDAPTPPGARTPGPGVSRAPTTRSTPRTVRRYPSGPGGLEYDDAERARHERFVELERQLADITQDAAEAELRRDHEFQDKEADRDRHFGANESRREADARQIMDEMSSLLAQGQPPFAGVPELPPTEIGDSEAPLPVPGRRYGAPTPSQLDLPEEAQSVIASIRRASSESAARYADDIKGIVKGERDELTKQLQLEREESRAARDVLEQQVLAERARADDECHARIQELEDELARVRAELEHEKQQRINDEELRREDDARRQTEGGDEMRQQLSEITDLLLAHREEFARKKEVVEEHWDRKQEWREEDGRRWDEMYRLVQGIIDDRAEERERCEEERRAAAEKPCK